MKNTKRILVLSANPKGIVPLELDKEIRDIKDGLSKASNRENFQIEYCPAARKIDIIRFMLNFKPNIVHFSGHGVLKEGLVFENDDGYAHLASTKILSDLFEEFKETVECVVLNACYSKDQAEAISNSIKYVVGMNEAIEDNLAIEFSIAFYASVFAGKSYESAFNLAKINIRWDNENNESIPILYYNGKIYTSKENDIVSEDLELDLQNKITSAFKGKNRIGLIFGHSINDKVIENLNKFICKHFKTISIKPPMVSKSIDENIEIIECLLYISNNNHKLAWYDYIKEIAHEHDIPFMCIYESDLLPSSYKRGEI